MKTIPDQHQHRIAVETVKRPMLKLLGGMDLYEAERLLKEKFGYTDKQINLLKQSEYVCNEIR
jgi:hypothetical protein